MADGMASQTSSFDYDSPDVLDEVHRAIVAEMSGSVLAPLSDEEIAQREMEREIQQELYRQQEAEIAAAHEHERLAKAEQEQAEWLAEHRKVEAIRQRERAQEIDRLTTQRALTDLRLAAARQDTFQRNVENAQRNALAYQQHQTVLSHLEAMINPPEPPPERVVVVEADEEDDTFCGVKVTRPNPRRSWW